MNTTTAPLPQATQALERIVAAGYKLTAPRRAVVDAASRFSGSFSAAQIESILQAAGQPLGDASLFRTLKLLTDIGVMQRIHGIDDCHRYIMSNEQHAHRVVCTHCGAIAEFAECDLEPMIRVLEARTGFTIVDHLLELFGACQRCTSLSHPSE
jgi:Fur family ferric uptake transcriptional regulator